MFRFYVKLAQFTWFSMVWTKPRTKKYVRSAPFLRKELTLVHSDGIIILLKNILLRRRVYYVWFYGVESVGKKRIEVRCFTGYFERKDDRHGLRQSDGIGKSHQRAGGEGVPITYHFNGNGYEHRFFGWRPHPGYDGLWTHRLIVDKLNFPYIVF